MGAVSKRSHGFGPASTDLTLKLDLWVQQVYAAAGKLLFDFSSLPRLEPPINLTDQSSLLVPCSMSRGVMPPT